jgi:hypothetical protein
LLLFDDYQGAKVYLLKIYRFRKADPIKEKATRDLVNGMNEKLSLLPSCYQSNI